MKKRKKQIANLLKLGVFLFGVSLLLWNCQDETTTFVDTEIAKAHAWFNKNHNTLLEENSFFIGDANWDKAKIINEQVYVPVGNNIPVQINSNDSKIKYIYPYLLFQKEVQGNYIEEFKVYVSDRLTNIFEESINVDKITFSGSNTLLTSSFNLYSTSKQANLQGRGENCEVVNWYLVTYADGIEVDREYLYSTRECGNDVSDEDQLPPGGGGGSSSSTSEEVVAPPSCKSFNYSQVGTTNTQTAGVKGITFRIKYKDPYGTWHNRDILFSQPIYFTTPRFSDVNGGNLANGRGAELSADALQQAHRRAVAYFLATDATESQVRAKIWEYLRDEMRNGEVIGGSASFTPPLGFTGIVTKYRTSTWFSDNCD
ncbi:exported hypothetical protein [Tenacibaculum litoreum]|uniref:hypothetical protein n=1 Tax=Tenacibaculum litoreum TaxID=321269 RepID=UPI003893AA34